MHFSARKVMCARPLFPNHPLRAGFPYSNFNTHLVRLKFRLNFTSKRLRSFGKNGWRRPKEPTVPTVPLLSHAEHEA